MASCATVLLATVASPQESPGPLFDAFELNDVYTVLPNTLSVQAGGPSTQVISRQAIDGNIGYTLNVTVQYALTPLDTAAVEKLLAGRPYNTPNTVEYRTFLSHPSVDGPITTTLVDSGTTTISSTLATSFSIDFASSSDLADFIGGGSRFKLTTLVKFPQLTSLRPQTEEIKEAILTYLGANIISPTAPVLSTFRELSIIHPELVDRNPAQVLSALASVFDQAEVQIGDDGQPRLVLPPAFEVTINSAFSAPTNIRFTDQSVAALEIDVCKTGEFLILELGATGCENIDQLFQRFE